MDKPYLIDHLNRCLFLVCNKEGQDWYDPIKPYTLLEYRWVLNNVDIAGKSVVDAGAHHGHYTLVFQEAAQIVCIEPEPNNVTILQRNLNINDLEAVIKMDVIGRGNLPLLAPDAEIVKMDIEGAEFDTLPDAIDEMPGVKVWIVEVHPVKGNPELITSAFIERGFDLLYVNRQTMTVEPYQPGTRWKSHTTVIARKL